jgi:YHS domain-containing protein
MSRLLVIIILAAVVYVVIKGLQWLVFKSRTGPLARPIRGDEMIQDPACGLYIPKTKAIEGRVGGGTYFFCSPQCLEKYRVSARKGEGP